MRRFYEARRGLIKAEATLNKAKRFKMPLPMLDEACVDEWTATRGKIPSIAIASDIEIEGRFITSTAREALINPNKDHSGKFPLPDAPWELHPQFMLISNIDSSNPRAVISGNEKVIRPRLADAQFFFETDKKQTLASHVEKLDSILFQKQLGTVGDKARRLSSVSREIASALGGDETIAGRAGLLAKADLVSNMVTEFPEVQGIMGMHYARHDGEGEEIATAIEAHYHPRFAGDSLPTTKEGAAVALADKLDTLVGIFGIGQTPKGDKDPFALRRAAIGLLRILIEGKYAVSLDELVRIASHHYAGTIDITDAIQGDILEFLFGRFRAYYQEQGVAVDVIQAVLARKPMVPFDFEQRVKAVEAFKSHESAESLAAANKRVGNILSKVDESFEFNDIDVSLLTASEEIVLNETLSSVQDKIQPLVDTGEYREVLTALAELREPIDAFFDNVMVNAEDEKVRFNRLALLQRLRNVFLGVADISLLQS